MTEIWESRPSNQSGALLSYFSNLGQKYSFTLKAAEILQDISALCLCSAEVNTELVEQILICPFTEGDGLDCLKLWGVCSEEVGFVCVCVI